MALQAENEAATKRIRALQAAAAAAEASQRADNARLQQQLMRAQARSPLFFLQSIRPSLQSDSLQGTVPGQP